MEADVPPSYIVDNKRLRQIGIPSRSSPYQLTTVIMQKRTLWNSLRLFWMCKNRKSRPRLVEDAATDDASRSRQQRFEEEVNDAFEEEMQEGKVTVLEGHQTEKSRRSVLDLLSYVPCFRQPLDSSDV